MEKRRSNGFWECGNNIKRKKSSKESIKTGRGICSAPKEKGSTNQNKAWYYVGTSLFLKGNSGSPSNG